MKQKRCPDFSVHAINQWFTSNRWMPHCVQKTAAVRLDDALWNINKGMLYLLLMASETWLYHFSCLFQCTSHIQRRAALIRRHRSRLVVAFIIGPPAQFSTAAFDRCLESSETPGMLRNAMNSLAPVLQSISNSEGADADAVGIP